MRHMGQFKVNRSLWDKEGFQWREAVMDGVVVWHIDMRLHTNELVFFAEHRNFNNVQEGERVPEYVAEITPLDEAMGTFSRKWVQVEEPSS